MALSRWIAPLVALSVSIPAADAQCPEWTPGYARAAVLVTGVVTDFATFDLGTGPKLYVSGSFQAPLLHGSYGLAAWDGTTWAEVPGAPDGSYSAIEVLDLGSGPALYSACQLLGSPVTFQVARYDANGWTVLGTAPGGLFRSFEAFDDGSGRKLYVGGRDLRIGGLPISTTLARLDGASWTAVVAWPTDIFAMEVHDAGAGPRLHIGGQFNSVAGTPAANVASWNGTAWSPLGAGANLSVFALRVLDLGAGPRLVAGGSFTQAGGQPATFAASWNGGAWSPLAGFVHPEFVTDLDMHAGAPVAMSYLGIVKRWNGSSFVAISGPANGGTFGFGAVESIDFGGGATLFASATDLGLGDDATGLVAQWTGSNWHAVPEFGAGFDNTVEAIEEAVIGGQPALYAAGTFTAASGVATKSIARFDGASWSTVGGPGVTSPISGAVCLESFDDGGVGALYLGGVFTQVDGVPVKNVARWDGTSWSALGNELSGSVRALTAHDDGNGPELYAGGQFTLTGGRHIARWNGAAWLPLDAGVDPLDGGGQFPDAAYVDDIASFDDGLGAKLVIAGFFGSVSGVLAGGVARWDGAVWQAMPGIAANLSMHDLHEWNGSLYVGGYDGLWRWNGASFDHVATTTPGGRRVRAMATITEGGTTRLLVAGEFSGIGGITASNVASFDGLSWSAVDGGTNGRVMALLATTSPDGDGNLVYAGGAFGAAGGLVSTNFGALELCSPYTTFCVGDGSGSACPCGNSSPLGSGAGCTSSIGTGGRLVAAGTNLVSSDTLGLTASGVPATTTALFFQGTNDVAGGAGTSFGDGLRCAGGTVTRLAARTAVAGVVSLDSAPSSRLATLGSVSAGSTVRYQAWYRNIAPFCTPSGFNLTNGIRVTWGS